MIRTGYLITFAITCTLLALNAVSADQADPFTARPTVPQQQYSNVCVTPVVSCYLPGPAPSGTPCWCATPYGPVNGRVR